MEDKNTFSEHPIQLIDFRVLELSYNLKIHAEAKEPESLSDKSNEFKFYHTHSDYKEDTQTFFVKIKSEIGDIDEETESDYTLNVEVMGVFKVDEKRFDKSKVGAFADYNAPLVLYPYLREQVFGMATRAGIKQPILPLFEVKQFSK